MNQLSPTRKQRKQNNYMTRHKRSICLSGIDAKKVNEYYTINQNKPEAAMGGLFSLWY